MSWHRNFYPKACCKEAALNGRQKSRRPPNEVTFIYGWPWQAIFLLVRCQSAIKRPSRPQVGEEISSALHNAERRLDSLESLFNPL